MDFTLFQIKINIVIRNNTWEQLGDILHFENIIFHNSLKAWQDGTFEGGKIVVYGAAEGGVGLPWESTKFENFNKEDYDALLERISMNCR